jgi:hypothetical protein
MVMDGGAEAAPYRFEAPSRRLRTPPSRSPTVANEVVSPTARATAIGLLNVASGALSSWWNPLIGFYRDLGGDLGLALAFPATPASVAARLLLVDVLFLLPRDHLGPLRLPGHVRCR